MGSRKTHEEKAMTRLRRFSARMRRDIEELSYAFAESEAHGISAVAEDLYQALDTFDRDAAEEFAHYLEERAG